MNGIYVRRQPPQVDEDDENARSHMLHYVHMDSGWTMALVEVKEEEASRYMYYREEESEWLFIDQRSGDRFKHKGNTIVPGAGMSWKHVHRSSARASGESRPSAAARLGGAFGMGSQLTTANDNEDELPWQVNCRPR